MKKIVVSIIGLLAIIAVIDLLVEAPSSPVKPDAIDKSGSAEKQAAPSPTDSNDSKPPATAAAHTAAVASFETEKSDDGTGLVTYVFEFQAPQSAHYAGEEVMFRINQNGATDWSEGVSVGNLDLDVHKSKFQLEEKKKYWVSAWRKDGMWVQIDCTESPNQMLYRAPFKISGQVSLEIKKAANP